MPSFVFLFHPTAVTLTFRRITTLLRAEFDTEGTNRNTLERNAYSAFLRYLREVASGRRENLCLGSILQFITGTDEEPVLGFKIQPSIRFVEVDQSYIPTANTCINCLTLPCARVGTDSNLPDDQELFSLYDYAFCNNFLGLQ
ncbi:uncharacterized protein LOC133203233 [Saccostrea echinata]|uniref:uncharacterized protein LOC133203233 n=1 Tax=Saccostrea echinata TaxID=191078 RepID=UPI002A7FC9C9|nr:uncharacterized protein LOC133203233 [Saccostrea echinata]